MCEVGDQTPKTDYLQLGQNFYDQVPLRYILEASAQNHTPIEIVRRRDVPTAHKLITASNDPTVLRPSSPSRIAIFLARTLEPYPKWFDYLKMYQVEERAYRTDGNFNGSNRWRDNIVPTYLHWLKAKQDIAKKAQARAGNISALITDGIDQIFPQYFEASAFLLPGRSQRPRV